jgi:hypothetical protein
MQGTLAPFVISCLLVSCNNGVDGKIEDMPEQVEIDKDPVSTEIVQQSLKSKIPEPFRIAEFSRLDFTSGGTPARIREEFCDSLTTGFLGNYYLIDKDFSDANGRPVGGIITVHVDGKMGSWKSDDTTQTILKIHLLSDVISVWDSIHVGLTREEVERFGKANDGFCFEKGHLAYSCDFNNFSADYIFKDDILTELTVRRNCESE